MDELKPCPFCGGEADFYLGVSGYLQCTHCLAMIPYDALLPYAEGKKKAIAAWNRRPAPGNKPLTLEQLTLDQLRQMDGEPVWWWNKSHAPVCTICIARLNEVSFVDFDYSHDDSTGIVKYERWVKWGFKPYARKPEQEEK